MSQALPKEVPQTLRRWKRYSAYKDSGIEEFWEVPTHWKITKLRWYLSLRSGDYISNTDFDIEADDSKSFPVIGGNGVAGFSARYNVCKPTIAIGRVGALCGNIHLINENSWVTDNALLISNWREFEREYLGLLLTVMDLNKQASQNAQPLITGSLVKNQIAALPPVTEQRAIASFLDHETAKIDALIAKKERLIKLLQEKRTAIISHVVTKGLDPSVPLKDSCVDWLGKVPMHWRVIQLRRCWKVIDCKHRTAEYFDEGIPIVSTTEVKPGRLNLENTRLTSEAEFLDLTEGRLPKPGDIIYSRNASVGSAAYVDTEQPFCMGQDVCLITSTNQNQLFLSYLLNSPIVLGQLESLMVGSTINRINVGQIQRFWVLCPPSDEQAAIASYLDRETTKIDALIAKIREGIEKLKEYRIALISAAVTGKIDVRNEVAS